MSADCGTTASTGAPPCSHGSSGAPCWGAALLARFLGHGDVDPGADLAHLCAVVAAALPYDAAVLRDAARAGGGPRMAAARAFLDLFEAPAPASAADVAAAVHDLVRGDGAAADMRAAALEYVQRQCADDTARWRQYLGALDDVPMLRASLAHLGKQRGVAGLVDALPDTLHRGAMLDAVEAAVFGGGAGACCPPSRRPVGRGEAKNIHTRHRPTPPHRHPADSSQLPSSQQ